MDCGIHCSHAHVGVHHILADRTGAECTNHVHAATREFELGKKLCCVQSQSSVNCVLETIMTLTTTTGQVGCEAEQALQEVL
jgi:hypothetical protein